MKKKIASLLLVCVLLLTYTPMQVFAAPEDELLDGIDWSWDMVANSASELDVGGTAEENPGTGAYVDFEA